MYWKRWIKEYLPLLTLQNKWTKHRKNMKIGDSYIYRRQHRTIEMALGTSYKIVLWKR